MRIVDKILSDRFFKNSAIYFTGTVAVGFLNYLFHPILSRLMGVEDFGDVQAFLSFFVLVGPLVAVFGSICVNITAHSGDEKEKIIIISHLRKIAFYVAAAVFLFLLASSYFLKGFFNFSSLSSFILLLVSPLLVVSITMRNAFLQGTRNFKSLAYNGIIASISRLVFSVLFVVIGWHVFGAVCGMLMAQLVTLGYLFWKTKDKLTFVPVLGPLFTKKIYGELGYGLLVLVVSLTATFLYSADVLVVKHYFSATQAGLYSGIAIVGRVIFFLSASVGAVLFPSITKDNTVAENNKLLFKALFIVFLLGGSACLFFVLFPSWLVHLLIGSRYLDYVYLLPRLGLLSFLAAIAQILFFYYLALRQKFILFPAIIGVTIDVLLSYFNHANLYAIVNNFIFGSLTVIILLIIPRLYVYFKPKTWQKIN